MNLQLAQILSWAISISLGFLLAGCSSSSSVQAPGNSRQPIKDPANPTEVPKESVLIEKAHQAKAQIENEISKGISIGHDSSQVVDWLKSENMEVQRINRATFDREDYKTVILRNGYQPAELGAVIVSFRSVSVQDSSFAGPIVFFFDKEDRLVTFSIESIWQDEPKRVPATP